LAAFRIYKYHRHRIAHPTLWHSGALRFHAHRSIVNRNVESYRGVVVLQKPKRQ